MRIVSKVKENSGLIIGVIVLIVLALAVRDLSVKIGEWYSTIRTYDIIIIRR